MFGARVNRKGVADLHRIHAALKVHSITHASTLNCVLFCSAGIGICQFFLGTEVQYLPLSFVRDSCGVKVDCKDDVHSKQRLGDLPKPLR